jgi:hypothetical protein
MRWGLVIAAALAAASCSGKKTATGGSAATAPTPTPSPGDAASAHPAAGSNAAPTRPPALTADQRAAYRALAKQGHALAHAHKWKEAEAAYQQAVAIDPGNARGYSDLGFVALGAHDYDLASKASKRSVVLAVDLDLKAASLYNAGRAAEETGHPEVARLIYIDSLRYRPNSVVKARLEKLGGAPPEPVERTSFDSTHHMCAYLTDGQRATDEWNEALEPQPFCERADQATGPLQVWGAGMRDAQETQSDYYAVLVAPGQFDIVADLGYVGVPAWHQGDFAVDAIESSTVGGHHVYRIRARNEDQTQDGVEQTTDKTSWFCVEATAGITCPVEITTSSVYDADVNTDFHDPDAVADFIRDHGQKPPIHHGYEVRATVRPDGKITVERVSGDPDKDLLKTLTLW